MYVPLRSKFGKIALKNVSSKPLVLIIGIIIFMVLLYSLLFISDIKLWVHANKIYRYPLPSESTLINTSAHLIDGGGSRCVSEVRLFLKSNLTYGEIEQYYKNAPVIKGVIFAHVVQSINGQPALIEVVESGAIFGC